MLLFHAITSLGLAVGCLGAPPTAVAQDAPTTRTIDRPVRTPPDAELVFETKTVPPHEVTYLEHEGPYWRLGPLFRTIDNARRQLATDAPMYARFCAPPLDPRAAACTTEVGLITDAPARTASGFHTAHRDAERVAFTVIRSNVASTRRHYDPLYKWIQENGFTATGPVTEVHLPPAKDQAISGPGTELRVTIEPQTDAPLDNPEAKQTDPEREPVAETPGTVKAAKRASTAQPAESVQPDAVDHATDPATDPTSDETQLERQPPRPIAELIAEKDWDRIARQIMPTDLDIPAPMQLWFGQVVFRIGALGKGMKRQGAEADPGAVALAEAVTRRYRKVSARFTMDPLSQAVVRIDPRQDPNADRKRSILRDLDALLAKVAQRALDPKDALDTLSDLLQRTCDVLHECEP